jgi:hypothetical protein
MGINGGSSLVGKDDGDWRSGSNGEENILRDLFSFARSSDEGEFEKKDKQQNVSIFEAEGRKRKMIRTNVLEWQCLSRLLHWRVETDLWRHANNDSR